MIFRQIYYGVSYNEDIITGILIGFIMGLAVSAITYVIVRR